MIRLKFATKWPFAVLLILAIVVGCRKDLSDLPLSDNKLEQADRAINLNEVMARFAPEGGGAQNRSGEKLPLCVTPIWNESYIVSPSGFPVLITPIDTPATLPGTRFGGSLAFYKDPAGQIQSKLIFWASDSLSVFLSNRAPLDATGQFNGTMLMVSQEDTIEKFVKVVNGYVSHKGEVKYPFSSIASGFSAPNPIANDRDPKCPQWGNNGIDWSWWNTFWHNFGVVAGNVWDAINGGSESYSGSYFFPGGFLGWETPEGYNQPGGSGNFDQQFSNQMSTCAAINDYMLSFGVAPPGYSQTDLDFCMIINEAGLSGSEAMCLYTQYGYPQQDDIIKYWNSSPKDISTAEKLKAYIMGRCNGSFAPLLVNLLKDKFFLSQHPIDLMEDIKNDCGFTSYDGPEWETAFNSGLSQCAKGVIIDDWFDLTTDEKTLLLNDQVLFDKIGSFITSKGGDAPSKDAAQSLIRLIAQNKFPEFKEEDFIDPSLYVNFVVNMTRLRILHPDWNSYEVYLEAAWQTLKDPLHVALDICGLTPFFGEPCDLANGVLFLIEGDGMNATLSFAATIPIAGWVATGAKYASIAVKIVGTGAEHVLKLSNVGGVITFGARSDLRTVMGITDAANDAHHLIPWAKQDHELVQLAAKAKNTPFHMNHPKNGKELKRFRLDQGDGIHGNHPAYNTKVENNLDDILEELGTIYGGTSNIPPDVASQRLRDFQNQLGDLIDQNPQTKINDLNF